MSGCGETAGGKADKEPLGRDREKCNTNYKIL